MGPRGRTANVLGRGYFLPVDILDRRPSTHWRAIVAKIA